MPRGAAVPLQRDERAAGAYACASGPGIEAACVPVIEPRQAAALQAISALPA